MSRKSFWESENKIPIGQKSVIIKSENNLDHTAGQRVRFIIPQNTEFINPKETYFRCDVDISITAGAKTNLQLDADIGGQVLIRDISIKTRDGKILEEIQGYNTLVALMYDYDTNENLKNKRGLTEGSTVYNPLLTGNNGCERLNQNDCLNNPYFYRETEASTSSTASNFKTAKLLLPLHTGIFSNDRVFPTLLSSDLIVDMTLEENARVFRQLDTVNKFRNIGNNPHFLNLTGADAFAAAADGDDVSTIFLDPAENSMNSLENFPFRVGESFKLVDSETFAVSASGNITREDVTSASGVAGGHFVITELEETVGTGANQKVKVTVASGSLSGSDLTANTVMVSTACEYTTDLVASYTLSNLELVVQQLDMPQGYKASMMKSMKSGGTMMYDFLSYTNYRFSTLASESIINLRLPLQNSRAKSILCVPTDATTRSLPANTGAVNTYYQCQDARSAGQSAVFSDRVGLEGCADFLQNYQFLYDNKLQPNRKVDVSKTGDKTSISQNGLIELEKSLAQANIDVKSFRKFNKNFVVGRALTLGKESVYDTRGKDFSLQLEYNGSIPQQVNKLWNCYCAHVRGLRISGENIEVVL